MKTWFGKCIFISWYCDLATCKFCFRSQQKNKDPKKAKRSLASILAEAFIAKKLGWRIEFITGGCESITFKDLLIMVKNIKEIYEKKIWINLGFFTEKQLEQLKPYVEGICASIETIEPKLHKKVCPDKPIKPYEDMLKKARGFKKSITIVIGLGEKKQDIKLLLDFIKRNKLDRITFYALKPVQGTPYTKSPEKEYYAWWIEQTRIKFPKLEIIAGLTPKKVDYTNLVLKAGANAITKFPAIRKFNSLQAKQIEKEVKKANKEFSGSLTKLPKINWNKEIDKLNIEKELKEQTRKKILMYLGVMEKSKG